MPSMVVSHRLHLFLAAISVSLLTVLTKSVPTPWLQVMEVDSTGVEVIHRGIETSDGNIMVAGYIRYGDHLIFDSMLLMKVDQSGNEIWSFTCDGVYIVDVLEIDGGDFVISGSYGRKLFLARLNSVGNLVWFSPLETSGNHTTVGFHMAYDSVNDMIVLAGWRMVNPHDKIPTGLLNSTQSILAAFSLAGDFIRLSIWENPVGPSYALKPLHLGGSQYMILGSAKMEQTHRDVSFIKLDIQKWKDGHDDDAVIDHFTWGTIDEEALWAHTLTKNGEIVVGGFSFHQEQSAVNEKHHAFIARFSQSGEEIWAYKWGYGRADVFNSIIENEDGHLLVTGNVMEPGNIDTDMVVMKLTASGEKVWAHTLEREAHDAGHTIFATKDKSVFVAGQTHQRTDIGTVSNSAWISKFTPEGFLERDCSRQLTESLVKLETIPANSKFVKRPETTRFGQLQADVFDLGLSFKLLWVSRYFLCQRIEIELSNNHVDEHAPPGTEVGDIFITNYRGEHQIRVVLSHNPKDVFAISEEGKLVVNDNKSLDYNYHSKILFAITVVDTETGDKLRTKNLHVHLADRNEQPFDIILFRHEVKHTFNSGDVVAEIYIRDPDREDSHEIFLDATSSELFSVSNSQLISKKSLDLLDLPLNQMVDITALDRDHAKLTRSFPVRSFEDLRFFKLDTDQIPEDIAPEEEFAKIRLPSNLTNRGPAHVEVNQGEHQIFTIRQNRTGNLDQDDAEETIEYTLWTGRDVDFDYESSHHYQLQLEYTFSYDKLTIKQNIQLRILDAPEAPTNLRLSNMEIAENSPPGTVIGRLTVEDPDEGDVITFHVISPAIGLMISETDDLLVGDGLPLDAEQGLILAVKISATDSQSMSIVETFILKILPVNEFSPEGIEFSWLYIVDELPPDGLIGIFNVIDQDIGDVHTLSLNHASNELFYLNAKDELHLQPFGKIDKSRVNVGSYSIEVTATDSGGKYLTKNFALRVIDRKTPPFDVRPDLIIVERPHDGFVVGSVYNGEGKWSDAYDRIILLCDANGRFELIGDELIVKEGKNIVQADINLAYSLVVRYVDHKERGFKKLFTIMVKTRNDFSPIDLILLGMNIKENSPEGKLVGRLQVIDEDVDDSHTIELIDDYDGAFMVTNDHKLVVRNGDLLDHEREPFATVRFRVCDREHCLEKSFRLNVVDVNEPPTRIELSEQTFTLPERGSIVVGIFKVTDPDEGDYHRVSIDRTSDFHRCFDIDDMKLVFVTSEDCKLSDKDDSVALKVSAYDADDAPLSAKFYLEVLHQEGGTELVAMITWMISLMIIILLIVCFAMSSLKRQAGVSDGRVGSSAKKTLDKTFKGRLRNATLKKFQLLDERLSFDFPNTYADYFTGELMVVPAVSLSGYSFEKAKLVDFVETHGCDPVSQQKMTLNDVKDNISLKQLIEDWIKGLTRSHFQVNPDLQRIIRRWLDKHIDPSTKQLPSEFNDIHTILGEFSDENAGDVTISTEMGLFEDNSRIDP